MPIFEPTPLGVKIKSLREQKQMTISDLNRLTGIAIGTIGDIERGKARNPGIFTIQKLARAMGVSILYFLDDDPGMDIEHPQSTAGRYLYHEQFINLLKDTRFTEYFIVTQKAYDAGIDPLTLNALVDAMIYKESGDKANKINKTGKTTFIQR
jgi:transcriptional regulator with XRE-family HTH domain